MFKFWSDPQPDSLGWLNCPALEGKFAARYMHRCTEIGVVSAAFTCPLFSPPRLSSPTQRACSLEHV
jgi:hypothetical protein